MINMLNLFVLIFVFFGTSVYAQSAFEWGGPDDRTTTRLVLQHSNDYFAELVITNRLSVPITIDDIEFELNLDGLYVYVVYDDTPGSIPDNLVIILEGGYCLVNSDYQFSIRENETIVLFIDPCLSS